jgi:hypothetical protein
MSALVLAITICAPAGAAVVEPGQLITPGNASLVATLVSPGNFILVRQGMRMRIGSTGRIDFPPPYQDATEKYSGQVTLNHKGELEHYVAGLPFPLVDPNDPQVATKVMWNLSFGPELADTIQNTHACAADKLVPRARFFEVRIRIDISPGGV